MLKIVNMGITILIIFSFAIEQGWSVPPPPHSFWGTVKKDGTNVPDGTTVSAWIGSTQYAQTITSIQGGHSTYILNVPGDDPDEPGKQGGVPGDIIAFRIGGDTALQTAPFSSGGGTALDLTTLTQYTLTLSASPSNGGYVDRNPNKSAYNPGDQVALTAYPYANYTFSHWSGDASGTSPTVSIIMTSHKTVTAHFTYNPQLYTLTVNIDPAGGGSVAKNPSNENYLSGEQVVLTASANPGYAFSNWSGNASGTTPTTTLIMDDNKTVTAHFKSSILEKVSTPDAPSGPAAGMTGQTYSYATGGSASDLGHLVQYLFEWGDGSNSGWLPAAQTSATKAWGSDGTYQVRARARCLEHPAVVSEWSETFSVTITATIVIPFGMLENPSDGQKVSGITTIHGWALDNKGVTGVELFINDQRVGMIPYGSTRKDVEAVYPGYPNAEHSGFSILFNYSILPEGPHTVKARIRNRDDQAIDLIANVFVKKFHVEFIEKASPGAIWLRNWSFTGEGLTGKYDVKLEWSNETQGFTITEIIAK